MNTYTVKAIRSGKWWAIEIPEVNDGIFTQALRFTEVEGMARDAIALTLDISPDSFDVAVELPSHIKAVLEEMRLVTDAAQFANWLAAIKAHNVVQSLHEQEHLSLREIGQVLGISHQRAHQLLSEVSEEDAEKRKAWETVRTTK